MFDGRNKVWATDVLSNENESIRKRFQKWRNLKMQEYRFCVNVRNTEPFENNNVGWRHCVKTNIADEQMEILLLLLTGFIACYLVFLYHVI